MHCVLRAVHLALIPQKNPRKYSIGWHQRGGLPVAGTWFPVPPPGPTDRRSHLGTTLAAASAHTHKGTSSNQPSRPLPQSGTPPGVRPAPSAGSLPCYPSCPSCPVPCPLRRWHSCAPRPSLNPSSLTGTEATPGPLRGSEPTTCALSHGPPAPLPSCGPLIKTC